MISGMINSRNSLNNVLNVTKMRTNTSGNKLPNMIPKTIAMMMRKSNPTFIFFISYINLSLSFTQGLEAAIFAMIRIRRLGKISFGTEQLLQ